MSLVAEVYKLPVEYRRMLDSIDWNGELQVIDFIDEVDIDLDEKPFHIARLIKSCEGEIGLLKDEISRLQSLKSVAEMNRQNLRQYLTMLMNTLDRKALDNGILKISLRATRPKLIIEDEDFIPDRFVKVETIMQKTVDKDAIKQELESGSEIDGIYFLTDQTVVIK